MKVFIGTILGLVFTAIFGALGLFKEKRLPHLTLLFSFITSIFGWKIFEKYQKGIVAALFTIAVICIGVNISQIRDDSTISSSDSSTSSSDGPIGSSDGSIGSSGSSESPFMDFLPVTEIAADAEYKGEKYFPILDLSDYQHIFITMPEELVGIDEKSVTENVVYTLKNLSDIQLKDKVEKTYKRTCQSIQNFPLEKVYADTIIGNLIEESHKLDDELKLAYANNDPKIELYSKLAKCYEEMVERAPRGNFYLQLGRPYEEQIVHMGRESDKEKNDVFKSGAKAVATFRSAQTYKGDCGDTDAHLFYRIANIYHYLGDTSNLNIEIRSCTNSRRTHLDGKFSACLCQKILKYTQYSCAFLASAVKKFARQSAHFSYWYSF